MRGRDGVPSDRQTLAPLGPAALEHDPTSMRVHAGAEPVGTGTLALLGLVGALHRAGKSRPCLRDARRPPARAFYPRFATCPGVPFGGSDRRWYVRCAAVANRPARRAAASARRTLSNQESRYRCRDRTHRRPWSTVDAHLRRACRRPSTTSGSQHLRPAGVEGTRLIVTAPDSVRAWVSERFARVLRAAAGEALGPDATIELVAPGGEAAIDAPEPQDRPAALNPKYTFDQFVIGDANRFAHAAALAVAEPPGHTYNPLFIYGPPGVGKTHLLHSIAAYVRATAAGSRSATRPSRSSRTRSSPRCTRATWRPSRQRFRRTDVLLIDDIQFLESKVRTEEEFFHTFNALYETGSQIVGHVDRLPRDLDELQERLRERFEAGLVADIGEPDLQTRLAVLRKRAQYDDIDPHRRRRGPRPDRPTDHDQHPRARGRAGSRGRIRLARRAHGRSRARRRRPRPSLPPAARRLGSHPPRHNVGPADPAARRRSVRPERRRAPQRDRSARVAWPRQLAMYLAREHTDASLPGARQGVRRPQPHHGHPCLPTGRRADRLRPRRVRRPFGP